MESLCEDRFSHLSLNRSSVTKRIGVLPKNVSLEILSNGCVTGEYRLNRWMIKG